LRIGILGTGTLAAALAGGWARAGHEVVIGGRSAAKAQALADRLGAGVRAANPRAASSGRDAVLIAVSWDGVADILRSAGANVVLSRRLADWNHRDQFCFAHRWPYCSNIHS